MSFFRCPICSAPLKRGERAYTCPGGHSFDRSAAGYVHLLPVNRKHSQNPGDDKAMVAARSAFLDKGYYSPLREALCDLALRDTADLSAPRPAGQRLRGGLLHPGAVPGPGPGGPHPGAGRGGHLQICPAPGGQAGEGRGVRRGLGVPSAGGGLSADLLTNVFSPLCRGVRPGDAPGGYFYYVVPSAKHLWR